MNIFPCVLIRHILKECYFVKKDYDVIYQAHCILDSYIKKSKMQTARTAYAPAPEGKKRKPHNISVTPLIVLALIFAVLCVVNIIMWFSL